jgi:hypothetical protein
MWFLDKGAVAQVTAFFPFVALYNQLGVIRNWPTVHQRF